MMKIKSGFVCHSIGNEHVVVAIEERTTEFCGMIRLNATGAFLWEQLQKESTEEALINALMTEYGITAELAKEAVISFVKTLSDAGVMES